MQGRNHRQTQVVNYNNINGMRKLKILVTNDDGHLSPGIQALADAVKIFGEVTVMAPDQNASATSSCLTVIRPLRVGQTEKGFYYINGTPCDCVHVALSGIIGFKPDLIVSGINNGANLGDDTIHSGTFGAAQEGYLFRIPSISFSLASREWTYLDTAKRIIHELMRRLLERHHIGAGYTGEPWLLNVNIPGCSYDEIQGTELTRLGMRKVSQPAVRAQDPYGHDVYWVGMLGAPDNPQPGTDFHAVANGRVSITPMHVNMTDCENMDMWGFLS